MDTERVLDRYRLTERLASGGSAEVWRAHDEQLDRPVAVKRLHPHLLPDDGSRQRLVTEARAAARLSHPAIVDVYDVDATGEWPAIVMELVEGEPLSARIARDGPLDEIAAATIGAEVAEALELLNSSDGLVRARATLQSYADAADAELAQLPAGPAHDAMSSLVRYTIARVG